MRMLEYADQESHHDPLKSGFGFAVITTIGDSREVHRALGLALWIFGAAGKESILPCQRDRHNQVLGNAISIHECHWIWTCVFGIRSPEHGVLRVFIRTQLACLFPKQVIPIFTPSVRP